MGIAALKKLEEMNIAISHMKCIHFASSCFVKKQSLNYPSLKSTNFVSKSLIHYLVAPLILFLVPYTVSLVL